MKSISFAALAAIVVAGVAPGLAAQSVGERFSFEPYGGIYVDNAYRSDFDLDRAGALGGVRVRYQLTDRLGLVGDVGYAEVNDVGTVGVTPDLFIYGVNNVFTTAGVEYALTGGRTRARIGLRAGAAWRETEIEGAIGNPAPQWGEVGGYSAQFLAAPGVGLSQRLVERLDLELMLTDYLAFEDPLDHSPAVTLGLSLR